MTNDRSAKAASMPISADSHVVEGPEVFDGLADRFGDDAPYSKDPAGSVPGPVAEIWKRQFYATIEDDQPAARQAITHDNVARLYGL